ncbi:hypothetical protein [uncultured Tateyamaria sp.]|uniref:hypothetical protein n=1 Tax=uncultured Tateyamaria sp. TaxID=455651 RepID=UPI0026025F69|nr:hypothetical protein [uncultured Tateyamaria sp.]
MPCVIQVFFKPHARSSDKFAFELIETDFEDLEQAMIAIAGDRLISGDALHTKWGAGKGERLVAGRHPIGFRGSAVDRVCLPTWKLIEEA